MTLTRAVSVALSILWSYTAQKSYPPVIRTIKKPHISEKLLRIDPFLFSKWLRFIQQITACRTGHAYNEFRLCVSR